MVIYRERVGKLNHGAELGITTNSQEKVGCQLSVDCTNYQAKFEIRRCRHAKRKSGDNFAHKGVARNDNIAHEVLPS